VTECARIWARHASWTDRTTRPTRRRVCELVGSERVHRGCPGCAPGAPCRRHPLSEAAYKAARRWLEAHGYLGLVSAGTTPAFRPGVLSSAEDGNEAAVHLLAVPHRRPRSRPAECDDTLIRPPSRSRSDQDGFLRTREARAEVKPGKARAPRGLTLLPPARRGPLHTCPQTRSDGLVAAEALRDRSRELGRLSPAMVRHLCRPLFAAGWTPADVLAAVDYAPDGRQHRYSRDVHHPAGWLRWRLARWLAPDGEPLPSPSQVRAAARERDRQDQAQRLADAQRLAERRSAEPGTHADRIRAALGWRRGPVAPAARSGR
jgi:hypothetical protein